MAVSIAWTTLVLFLLTGLPMWLLTGQIWDGIGLGAFCGFWGGPGFGAMAGGVVWAIRQERAQSDSSGDRTATRT